ncbi:hypothetical protein LXL04_007225 [Taraxacum kok-saghyz]
MAIVKTRSNKRSSGGSCSFTVTMLVLMMVCVLGFWMLTSSSEIYPSTTNHEINKAHDDSLLDTKRRSVKLHRKIPIDATLDKLLDHTTSNSSVSEDDHSDFLMDIIRNEDESKTHYDLEKIQEKNQDYKLKEDKISGSDNIETEPKQESTSINDVDDDSDSLNDSDAGKQEAEQIQEETIEKQEMEVSTSVIEDSLNGIEGEASAEEEQKHITQKIKENSMSKTGDQESGNDYDQQSDIKNQEDKQTEPSNTQDDKQELEDNQEQETGINEEKEKMQNQEDQEEEEEKGEVQQDDDEPIESHSVASETRSQAENREELDVRQKMEQAKIEFDIANITTNSTTLKKHSSQIPKVPETQVDQKERNEDDIKVEVDIEMYGYKWELCNVTAGTDYIPCLDNEIAIRNLHHLERNCPKETPECLVPLPKGYMTPIPWPGSRDKIWFHNVPIKALSDLKGHQNWVKVTGEIITFPSAGTRFIHGARHYIEFLEKAVPEIGWGKHTRVVLDVGCGVASFGGYLFDKDVLTMSFAPRDEQESQVQFALERGLPAISEVMGTQRLPFPSGVFDLVHCVHCRVPWHKEGGVLLLEVNRLLRPGGYFVWSATPVYRTLEEDIQIWKDPSPHFEVPTLGVVAYRVVAWTRKEGCQLGST